MTICTRNHEEICFDGGECPICNLREEYEQALDALRDSYQTQLDSLTDDKDYYKDLVAMHLPECLL